MPNGYYASGMRDSRDTRTRSRTLAVQKKSRAAKFTKARNSNQPVKRIQRKSYIPQKLKNTKSIGVLARQVRNLQRSAVGMYQTRREYIQAYPENGTQPRWTSVSPITFCANDFLSQLVQTSACKLVMHDGNSISTIRHWSRTHSAPVGGAFLKNDMNEDNDNDLVAPDHYLPISTSITFEFKMNLRPVEEAVFIRVDVVKPRPGKMLLNSTKHQYMLPESLQGFQNLAADPLNRNRINTGYYQVLQTKYVVLRNTKDTGDVATPIKKYMKLHIPLPSKILHTNLADYATTGETFGSNVPMADQVWVILSTSQQGGPMVTVNAMRDMRWRDNAGITAV